MAVADRLSELRRIVADRMQASSFSSSAPLSTPPSIPPVRASEASSGLRSIAQAYLALDDETDERYLRIQREIDELNGLVTGMEAVIEAERTGCTRAELKMSSEAFARGSKEVNGRAVLIKDLLEQARVSGHPIKNETEGRLHQAQHDVHVRRFQTALERFKHSVHRYQAVVDERTKRFLMIADESLSEEKAQTLIRSGSVSQADVAGLLDETVLDIQDQYEGVLRLERTVIELQELFQILNYLILEEQQVVLDRIQERVQETVVVVKESTGKLKVAEDDSWKNRRCAVLIFVVCALALLGAVVVLSVKL